MEKINLSDFKKLDLRVAKIVKAEKVENSAKLLKLKIDLGGEERQIIAGIAKDYQAEDLKEKEIVVIANLEPRVILGMDSQAMLLAATDDKTGKIILLRPDREITPGSSVS